MAVLEVAEELVERFDFSRFDVVQTFAYRYDRLLAFAPQHERFFWRDVGRTTRTELLADKLVETFELRSLVDAHGTPGIADANRGFIVFYRGYHHGQCVSKLINGTVREAKHIIPAPAEFTSVKRLIDRQKPTAATSFFSAWYAKPADYAISLPLPCR